jgi:hypothetical protein
MTIATPTTRTRRDERSAIPTVLRSEWIKLSSLRSNKAVLGLTAVIGFLVSWAVAALVTDEVLFVSEVFVYSTVLTALIASVMGILMFSSEAQHGTLGAMLSAQQARWVIATCKTAMAAAWGLALGAAGMAAGFAGALVGGLDMGDTSTIAATCAWALTFTALSAVLGLGIGMVVPNSAAAISGLLAWWFVLENLLIVFLPETIVRFLPYIAGFRMLGIASDFDTAEATAVALTRAQSALVFGGYAAAVLAAGTVLLYRRDAA